MIQAKIINCLSLASVVVVAQLVETLPQYRLDQAVTVAQQHDPWLRGSDYRQQATEATNIAGGLLPDRIVSLCIANLATDTCGFEFLIPQHTGA